ncbi:metallophosphoesterase [Clostridium disporicum]|uniref:Phosphoesterase n=1 Tax=Clostridium disporicum TaxID=84024 RepID=A0A174GYC7_9CLOT|nr:metallophosphoesterase [Clostridium disporicum]CUO65809.1 phosphoesterase [Clostridium disporicum]
MIKVRIKVIVLISIVALTAGIIIYNIYNNNQISVVTEEIKIENLPEEFDGFTILQLADLHSKSFGENQEDLINIINEQNFDMIAICGDMQDNDEEGYEIFITLLEGINNKEYVFYTPGNHGPFPFENDIGFTNFLSSDFNGRHRRVYNNEKTLSEAGERLKSLGVKLLNEAYEIKRGDSSLWVSELLYKEQLDVITNNEYDNNAINIAVTHYPMESVFDDENYRQHLSQYELVLAAHYHGGQWRIPGIGALFIPDINKAAYFPSQDRVSGLTEVGGIRQYVTRGLGAGGTYEFMRFRFFNRPEINLITLIKNYDKE